MSIPIGTTVQYVDEFGGVRAAIITWSNPLHSEVDLTVFSPNGNIDSYEAVPLSRSHEQHSWAPLS